MPQEPHGEGVPESAPLPDFASSSSPTGLPDFGEDHGPATLGEPSERARHRTRLTMIAVIGGSVVILLVLALILSQTVFR